MQLISKRVGRCLERQGLLEQDVENSWMMGANLETHSPRVLIYLASRTRRSSTQYWLTYAIKSWPPLHYLY